MGPSEKEDLGAWLKCGPRQDCAEIQINLQVFGIFYQNPSMVFADIDKLILKCT